jgi:hypothetical protein
MPIQTGRSRHSKQRENEAARPGVAARCGEQLFPQLRFSSLLLCRVREIGLAERKNLLRGGEEPPIFAAMTYG